MKWRFQIGDKVKLRKGHREKSLRGVVVNRVVDDVGVEMIEIDCSEPGWWQADWWLSAEKPTTKASVPA